MRRTNENELTPQQEKFCQYVVDAYGTNPKETYTQAYRMAYNVKDTTKPESVWSNACRLAKDVKVISRVKELEAERARVLTISQEDMVSRNVKRINADPLNFLKKDDKSGEWRQRKLYEMPKELRLLLVPRVLANGKIVWVLDKQSAEDAIIKILGFAAAKDINLKTNQFGELMFGFDDDDMVEQ